MSVKDPSWEDFGYDRFLSRSLKSSDPNYQTSEDYDLSTEDATIRSAKMGGKIYAKTIIVRDPATGLDRGLYGFQQGGF